MVEGTVAAVAFCLCPLTDGPSSSIAASGATSSNSGWQRSIRSRPPVKSPVNESTWGVSSQHAGLTVFNKNFDTSSEAVMVATSSNAA